MGLLIALILELISENHLPLPNLIKIIYSDTTGLEKGDVNRVQVHFKCIIAFHDFTQASTTLMAFYFLFLSNKVKSIAPSSYIVIS